MSSGLATDRITERDSQIPLFVILRFGDLAIRK